MPMCPIARGLFLSGVYVHNIEKTPPKTDKEIEMVDLSSTAENEKKNAKKI